MNPSEAQDATRTQSAGDTLNIVLFFMNIVQICVVEFFVCVILGLAPRIQVIDVASGREHNHCSPRIAL